MWIFLLTSVASLLILRKTLVGVFHGSEETAGLDDTPKVDAKVVKAIAPGIDGRVSFHGSFWPARAERHFAEGDSVMVSGYADGIKTILKVVEINRGDNA